MIFFYSLAYILLAFALAIFIWIAYHVLREKQRRGKHPEAIDSYYNSNLRESNLSPSATGTTAVPSVTSPHVSGDTQIKVGGAFLALPIISVAKSRKHKKDRVYNSYEQTYQRGMNVDPTGSGMPLDVDLDVNADVHNPLERRQIDVPDQSAYEPERIDCTETENPFDKDKLIDSGDKLDHFAESETKFFADASHSDSNERGLFGAHDFGGDSSRGNDYGTSSGGNDYGTSSGGNDYGMDGNSYGTDGGGGVGTDC